MIVLDFAQTPMGKAMKTHVCSECGEYPEIETGKWRMGFDGWEHHHGYPVGHMPSIPEDEYNREVVPGTRTDNA